MYNLASSSNFTLWCAYILKLSRQTRRGCSDVAEMSIGNWSSFPQIVWGNGHLFIKHTNTFSAHAKRARQFWTYIRWIICKSRDVNYPRGKRLFMGYFRVRSGLSSDPASPLVGSAFSRKCICHKPTPKHPAASEKIRLVPIIDVIPLPSIPLGRESPFSFLSSLASRLSSLDSFRSSFNSFLEPSSIFTSSLETLFCLAMLFWFNTPVPSTEGTSLTESRLVDEVFRGRK